MNTKGQMQQITGLAVGIATLAIVLVVTFIVLAQGQSQIGTASGVGCNTTSGTAGCNATKELTTAVDDIPGWIPLVVITTIGIALLGMIALFKRGM